MQLKSLDEFEFFNTQTFTRKNSECLQNNPGILDSFQYCTSLQLQDSSKECRICLEQIEDIAHIFISPCKCTGSLKYVHEKCFITWLERQYSSKSANQRKIMKNEGISCEICKQKLHLTFVDINTCLTHEQIHLKIKSYPILFGILIIFQLLIIASLAFILFFMQNSGSSFGTEVLSTLIIVFALVFLTVLSIITLFYVITKFCMEKRSKLQTFKLQKTPPKPKNKRQVMPIDPF